jgi:hypothetical protein
MHLNGDRMEIATGAQPLDAALDPPSATWIGDVERDRERTSIPGRLDATELQLVRNLREKRHQGT